MSLDDLRVLAHKLAKDVHELDTDRREEATRRATVDAQFAARDEALSTQAHNLAVELQNYTPPTEQPPVPPTPVRMRFAQHIYNNSRPVNVGAFDVYDVQRGFTTTGTFRPDAELYIYATIVRRPSDPEGFTQFLKPSLVLDAWCAHTPTGGLVTRTRGEGPEQLINIAVAAWRAKAIPNIVNEVVKYNATGLYVDEVDAWWKYAWSSIASTGAKEFRTEVYWRDMWQKFLKELADALHAKGKKLWINLGADYDLADPWQNALFDIVDAFNIEFYTGREGAAPGPTTLNDGWLSQNNFVAAVEQRGKPVHVHSSSLDPRVTDYAFTSWLLHTEFVGSFSASRDYGGTASTPSATLLSNARALGRPLGKREPVSGGFVRRFEGGTVTVRPSTQTGLIEPR